MARLCGKERNFTGEHFWARGHAVSTVGFESEQAREEEAKAREKSSLATFSSYGLSCEVGLTLLSSLVSDQLTTTAAASLRGRLLFRCT